jgi:hypothetical protein
MTSRCNLEGCFIPKGHCGLNEFERNRFSLPLRNGINAGG